jgi:hypothetical protein
VPTATIDEFDLDIRLQETGQAEKYPPPTAQHPCLTLDVSCANICVGG